MNEGEQLLTAHYCLEQKVPLSCSGWLLYDISEEFWGEHFERHHFSWFHDVWRAIMAQKRRKHQQTPPSDAGLCPKSTKKNLDIITNEKKKEKKKHYKGLITFSLLLCETSVQISATRLLYLHCYCLGATHPRWYLCCQAPSSRRTQTQDSNLAAAWSLNETRALLLQQHTVRIVWVCVCVCLRTHFCVHEHGCVRALTAPVWGMQRGIGVTRQSEQGSVPSV